MENYHLKIVCFLNPPVPVGQIPSPSPSAGRLDPHEHAGQM